MLRTLFMTLVYVTLLLVLVIIINNLAGCATRNEMREQKEVLKIHETKLMMLDGVITYIIFNEDVKWCVVQGELCKLKGGTSATCNKKVEQCVIAAYQMFLRSTGKLPQKPPAAPKQPPVAPEGPNNGRKNT